MSMTSGVGRQRMPRCSAEGRQRLRSTYLYMYRPWHLRQKSTPAGIRRNGESTHSRHKDHKGFILFTDCSKDVDELVWIMRKANDPSSRPRRYRYSITHLPLQHITEHIAHAHEYWESTSYINFVVATYTAVCSRHQRSYAFFWVDFFDVLSMVLSQPSPVCVSVIAFFWVDFFGVLSMVLSQPSPVCVSVPKARSELPT